MHIAIGLDNMSGVWSDPKASIYGFYDMFSFLAIIFHVLLVLKVKIQLDQRGTAQNIKCDFLDRPRPDLYLPD